MQLERIGKLVELSWNKRRILISTVQLPGGVWEHMVMYKSSGQEIECFHTKDRADAERAHALLVKRYTPKEKPEQKPLTGKYKQLAEDLRRTAAAAIQATKDSEDGGTCNFDSPALYLPRWNAEQIKQAAAAAGVGAFKWESFGPVKWVFCPRSGGQGNRRTRCAEHMAAGLQAAGYDVTMYYQMD